MAYTFSNKCAKNLSRRTVLLRLIVKNVVTCFFWNTVYVTVKQGSGFEISSPDAPLGEMFWFQLLKNMFNINTVSCSTLASDHSYYQQSATVGTCC